MAYWRNYRRRYKRWDNAPKKTVSDYGVTSKLGLISLDIKKIFFQLNAIDLKDLFKRYEKTYGKGKRRYAETTYPQWKTGQVGTSTETVSRLINLVPRYLTIEQKMELCEKLYKYYAPRPLHLRINIKYDAINKGIQDLNNAVKEIIDNTSNFKLPSEIQETMEWVHDSAVQGQQSMFEEINDKAVKENIGFSKKELARTINLIRTQFDMSIQQTIEFPRGSVQINCILEKSEETKTNERRKEIADKFIGVFWMAVIFSVLALIIFAGSK